MMAKNIVIQVGTQSLRAELNDTATAEKIFTALPIEAAGNTWGDEIYFQLPVQAELEDNARSAVSMGDLAYWPTMPAFCIFFGSTPASSGSERSAQPYVYLRHDTCTNKGCNRPGFSKQ